MFDHLSQQLAPFLQQLITLLLIAIIPLCLCVNGCKCLAEPGSGKEWGDGGIQACRRGYAKGSPRDFPCSLCDAKSTFFAPQKGLKGDKLC